MRLSKTNVLSVSKIEHAVYPIRISLKIYSEEKQKVTEKWKCWRCKQSEKDKKILHLEFGNTNHWVKLPHASPASRTAPRLDKQDAERLKVPLCLTKIGHVLTHRTISWNFWVWQLKADAAPCGSRRVNTLLCDWGLLIGPGSWCLLFYSGHLVYTSCSNVSSSHLQWCVNG